MHIVFERTRDTEQRIQGQKKHKREHVIQNRESTSRVHACESRVHRALFTFAFAAFAYGCAFARWNFLLHATNKNNNASKYFECLKQNNSKGFIGAP